MGVIQQSNPVTVAGELKTPYPELVHGLPVAVYCTDKDGLITMYNEAAADLWGRRPTIGSDAWCGSYKIFSRGFNGTSSERMPNGSCRQDESADPSARNHR